MDDIKRARRLLRLAPTLYEERLRICERARGRTRWSDGPVFALEPRFFAIHEIKIGKLLSRKPDAIHAGLREHAFDAGGRLVLLRVYNDTSGRCDEELIVYDGPIGERICYWDQGGHRALRADVFRYGDRIERMSTINAFGCEIEQVFSYVGRNLVGLDKRGNDENGVTIDERYVLEVDEDSDLTRVTRSVGQDKPREIFVCPHPHGDFARLRTEILIGIRDAMIRKLRQLTFSSPVYALVVNWCAEHVTGFFPPCLSFADVNVRKALIETRGLAEAAGYTLWNPAEWNEAEWADIPDGLRKKIDAANRDIWKNRLFDEVAPFCFELAAELSRARLPIPKTDDFVCYATSDDEGRGVEHLRLQTPPALLRRLEESGYLALSGDEWGHVEPDRP